MSKHLLAAVAAISTLAISGAACAHTVDMDNFVGQWFNEQGSPTNFLNSGAGNNPQVRWGVDQGSGQSGYNLDLAPPPSVPISEVVPPNTAPFLIGNFTHVNFPIGPNSITGIDLKVSFDITIDGSPIGPHDFFFHFAHDETTNNLDPCPYGGNNGQGVNINGCADRVVVSFLSASDSFTIGTDVYTFTLLGFSPDCSRPDSVSNTFLTIENETNTRQLCAAIALRSDVQAPEPGTLALLGLGLFGLRLVRRRLS